jgi:hypothetical protein
MKHLRTIQGIAAFSLLGLGFSLGSAIPKEKEYQIELNGDTAYVIKACDAPVETFRKAEQELKVNYEVRAATPITNGKCGTVAMRYQVRRLID